MGDGEIKGALNEHADFLNVRRDELVKRLVKFGGGNLHCSHCHNGASFSVELGRFKDDRNRTDYIDVTCNTCGFIARHDGKTLDRAAGHFEKPL